MADWKRKIVAEFSAQNKAKGEMASFRRDMDSTGQAMKRMAMGALAAVGGVYALKRAFDYSIKAAMKQEDAVFLLEASLKTAGEYAAETMEKFEAFAASIQKATVYGDEEVLALMQLMKSLGVTSDKLEQATRMAIGLAAATGRDVRSMSMYIALAQQGEFTMLRRYIPALRKTTDATEQLRIITEFAARGFDIARAKAETASGAISQFWNAVSDLAEVAAEPILEPMTKDVGNLTILIQEATKALKKYQKAYEEVRETREKFGLRPMDFPRVPMPDLEERFGKWLPPSKVGPLSELEISDLIMERNRTKAAELYKTLQQQAEQQKMMDEHRMKMLEKGGTQEEMEWRRDIERIRLTMAAEKAAAEEIEAVWTEMRLKEEEAAYHAMRAPILAAEEALQRTEERATEFAMTFRDVIASGFERSMRDAENWKEHMKSMLEEVYWAAIRMAFLEPTAGVLAKGMTVAMGRVFGADIFATPAPTTPTVFTSPHGGPVPSGQYGGEVWRTGLAVIHKGEKLSGVGGGVMKFDFHIHNEGSEKLQISKVEKYIVSDQRILNVTMQAMKTDGAYRRSVAGAAAR